MSETELGLIPTSYAEWKRCITVRCGIPLTRTYIDNRLQDLRDMQHAKTREFVAMYGDDYRQRIVGWFEQARREEP